TALLADVQKLGQSRARQMEVTSAALRLEAERRSSIMIAVIVGAILMGVAIVTSTVRSIDVPLSQLVSHARALSRGRLAVRTTGDMPGEFQELATAMNGTADSLSQVVDVAALTADKV